MVAAMALGEAIAGAGVCGVAAASCAESGGGAIVRIIWAVVDDACLHTVRS